MEEIEEAANRYVELNNDQTLALALKGATSTVYHVTEANIAFVKVDFPELGMYINSITIRPNPRDPEKLWVQMPKFRAGSRWISPLEFKTDSVLRKLVIWYSLYAYFVEFDYGTTEDVENFIDKHFP